MERRLGPIGPNRSAHFVAYYESCAQNIKLLFLKLGFYVVF